MYLLKEMALDLILLVLCIWILYKIVRFFWEVNKEVNQYGDVVAKERSEAGIRLVGETLYIERHHPHTWSLFKIDNHKFASYSNVPEELHFGAVTTGGFTSGGFYKTGGYINGKYHRSEKYEIIYKNWFYNADHKVEIKDVKIKKIVLSDQLAEKARNSPIKQYLEGNSIIIIHDVPTSEGTLMMARMGKTSEAVTLKELEDLEGYPTKEKCEAIVNWLKQP